MRLLAKNGKFKNLFEIDNNFYVSKSDLEDHKGGIVTLFYKVGNVAVLVGYRSYAGITQSIIDSMPEKVETYKNNLLNAIKMKSTISSHEAYTASFDYLKALIDISEDEHKEFIKNYEKLLEEQKIERDKKQAEEERLEKEKRRKEHLEYIENVKKSVLEDSNISGRDLLNLMIELNIDCPIKTKGMINRAYNMNSEDCMINGKVPQQSSINNLFKWYKIVKNTLEEEVEYNSLSESDKREIQSLFQ